MTSVTGRRFPRHLVVLPGLILVIATCHTARGATICADTGYGNASAAAEVTQGPYHVDEAIFRANVTEGEDGVPMRLLLTVLNTQCQPVADALVELWHANATGYYSGIADQNPGGGLPTTGEENANTTFLRGMWQTDANGLVEMYTIFPGSYSGRAVHIHYGVHIVTDDNGTISEDYADSHLSHIGQIFFEDALVDELVALEPYSKRGSDQVTYLEDDGVYTGDPATIANVTEDYPGHFAWGVTAALEAVVNPMTVEEFMIGGAGGGGMGSMPRDMGSAMSLGGPGDAGPPDLPTATAGRKLMR